MLAIGTSVLAKALYERWRARMEIVRPTSLDIVEDPWSVSVVVPEWSPRPRWEHLDSVETDVWRDVAEEACRVLAEAMGAR